MTSQKCRISKDTCNVQLGRLVWMVAKQTEPPFKTQLSLVESWCYNCAEGKRICFQPNPTPHSITLLPSL